MVVEDPPPAAVSGLHTVWWLRTVWWLHTVWWWHTLAGMVQFVSCKHAGEKVHQACVGCCVGVIGVETQTVMLNIPADPGMPESTERTIPQVKLTLCLDLKAVGSAFM